MSRYVLSRLALQDLLDIWEYIAADNVDAADRVSRDIEQALKTLAEGRPTSLGTGLPQVRSTPDTLEDQVTFSLVGRTEDRSTPSR